jgi:amidase
MPARPADRAGLKIAWAGRFPGAPISSEIHAELERLASAIDRSGIHIEEALPAISFDEEWETYQTISSAVWRLRARLHGIEEVDDGGEPPSLVELAEAIDQRERLIARWEDFLAEWDVLLCPPCMTTAYPHTERGSPILVDGVPARYDDEARYCYEFNVTGHPALVCPVGLSAAGLPIGVQLVAARWSDFKLIAIAGVLSESFQPVGSPPGYR